MKKLKTIKTIDYLKPERILQVNELYYRLYAPNLLSAPVTRTPLLAIQEEPINRSVENNVEAQEPDIIDAAELMKDLGGGESEIEGDTEDKENARRESKANRSGDSKNLALTNTSREKDEISESGDVFRRPDLDSGTLFDPKLLAAFEQAVMEVKALEAERITGSVMDSWHVNDNQEEEPPLKARKTEEVPNPLHEFEEKCPQGGSDSVVLYTTGLRGIRKTFEDCHRIRSLLENLRILFFERDISMHSEYKEELWAVLGRKEVPPRLFIKGRYIGGAEQVMTLHELGVLRSLFEGIPINENDGPCEGCGGIRFIVCFNCDGSQKVVVEGVFERITCSECNENGVIICPFCC